MAKSLRITTKSFHMLSLLSTSNFYRSLIPSSCGVRQLYSGPALGIDGYLLTRDKVKHQFGNMAEKFRTKMRDYIVENDSKSLIFTEDLKNMVHIAESKEDLALVKNMIKKFNKQDKELRFGNFVFGPVVMRMFHYLNAPNEALECFKSPEYDGFFDQLMTYQVLLDLLYESKRYDDVISTFEYIKSKQLSGTKYPKNIVVLCMASYYKKNDQEALKSALEMWKELQAVGHIPMRRAITFCAALALKQGDANVAYEIISSGRNQGYITVRDIKAMALADLGRIEDALMIVKSILNSDNPKPVKNTITKDALEHIRAAVEKCDSIELKKQFADAEKYILAEGHLSETSLDEQLCQTMTTPPNAPKGSQESFRRPPRNRYLGNRTENYNVRNQRPGLTDMN